MVKKNLILHYIKVVNNFFKRFNVVKSSFNEKYLIFKKHARKTTLCHSSVKCAQADAFASHIGFQPDSQNSAFQKLTL